MVNRDAFYFADTSFNLLMQKRIRKVLVICSSYDFFMLEEDGRIDEQIFNEYVSLNLRYPPVFVHADSARQSLYILENDQIDLIIPMLSVADVDTFKLARHIKEKYPLKPIVVLTHFSREVSLRLEKQDMSGIDFVFSWLGNTDIFLAIIKMIEDKMNAENDILEIGVQAILLVEDSVRYISSYLPNLYRIVLEQSKDFMLEALNEHQQMLRRRGRPKILLATTAQEANKLYQKYHNHILGIISDVSYKASPTRRDTKEKAGLKFCKKAKKDDPNLPFLLQSSEQNNEKYAKELGAGFLNKYSDNLSYELKEFILDNFGFGEFNFRNPKTGKVECTASNLKTLQEMILTVSDETLLHHAKQDDFSKWLNARALFPIAQKFKTVQQSDFQSIKEIRKFIYDTISSFRVSKARGIIAEFDKGRFDEYLFFSRIGEGSLGGKARGLAFMNSVIKKENLMNKYPGMLISVPATVVLTTDVFEEFMEINHLYEKSLVTDSDEKILEYFLEANFPEYIRDDLFAIASLASYPIAVRSSSKLEDSYYQPFAGIYNTYMVPIQSDKHKMVQMLEMAIKGVYASVFFKTSKSYIAVTSNLIDEEKMGIILQSVCGNNYNGRFYPTISGVARSVNYYPISPEKPEDGVANIAYGLGKIIVDGGTTLRFSPKYPKKIIQLSSPEMALGNTQKYFYALDLNPMSFIPSPDDSQNLLKLRMKEAENEESFNMVSSIYDMDNNIIRDGLDHSGKKIVTFSKILNYGTFPIAEIISDLLNISSKALNNPVEIEFAANLDTPEGEPAIFNYLQVRPIVANTDQSLVDLEKVDTDKLILYSKKAMGNGMITDIHDVIYIKPKVFDPARNRGLVNELEVLNNQFVNSGRNYILIGPGRWGSTDPWLGIPVKWTHISSARLIVEAGLENYRVDPSQGTHFFHNLTSFGVGYMSINPHIRDGKCDFEYLDGLSSEYESEKIRHVHSEEPFVIQIDGRTNKGAINKV